MRPVIRRVLTFLGFVVAAVVGLAIVLGLYIQLAWDRPVRRSVVAMTAPRDAQTVARGKYLYESSMLCWQCHGSEGGLSPSEPQAGGREFDMRTIGPGFGFVYGSNVTSDEQTGVGAWSDGELVRAIREGLDREGHLIFPVMAYQFYRGLSDADALSIVAYMRTLPPVRHEVPPARLSFAAKTLSTLGFVSAEPPITAPVAAPPKGRTAEYGRYVAWHVSGCAECHTPRDPQTAKVDHARPMAGGLFPFPEPHFSTTGSNLTFDSTTGIGNWTREQFVTAVQAGVRPNGTVLLPFMPWPSYARWDRDDVGAVWEYLRSIQPVSHAVAASQLAAPTAGATSSGDVIYGAYCLACHGVKGAGSPFTTSPLKTAARDLDDETLAMTIAEGMPGTAMPAFGKTLSKGQIQEITATIRSW